MLNIRANSMNQQGEQIKTKSGKYTCMECKNEMSIDPEKRTGDFIECEMCGIEYEVLHKDDEGDYLLQLLEEEK